MADNLHRVVASTPARLRFRGPRMPEVMQAPVRDSSTLTGFVKGCLNVSDGQSLVQKHSLRV